MALKGPIPDGPASQRGYRTVQDTRLIPGTATLELLARSQT